jgi:hypothetical protein
MQLGNLFELFKWRREAGGLAIALGGEGGAARGCAHDRHGFQGIGETEQFGCKDRNSGAGVRTISQWESRLCRCSLHIQELVTTSSTDALGSNLQVECQEQTENLDPRSRSIEGQPKISCTRLARRRRLEQRNTASDRGDIRAEYSLQSQTTTVRSKAIKKLRKAAKSFLNGEGSPQRLWNCQRSHHLWRPPDHVSLSHGSRS